MKRNNMVHKFDKIRRENKDEGATFQPEEIVIVEEKIDGANMRWWLDENNELRFGSRNVEFLPESDPNVAYGAFKRAVEYIKSLEVKWFQGVIYYGEAMIKHTLPYDFKKHPAVILFDMYDTELDVYYQRQEIDNLYPDVPKVPVIYEGELQGFDKKIPKSLYGDFQAEGYVIKPLKCGRDKFGNIHRAKVVGEKFKEEKREVWREATDKESAFAMKFTTTGRIDKMIHKLETAKEEKVQPQWISILTYNITQDICSEEFKKLLKIGTPDLRSIRREVQRQVKLRLQQLEVL